MNPSEGIEPNPGPLSFQVNCAMSNRLGGAIIDSLYPDDEFMVLLSQETRFSQSELASFTRNANKKVSGFTMLKGLQ